MNIYQAKFERDNKSDPTNWAIYLRKGQYYLKEIIPSRPIPSPTLEELRNRQGLKSESGNGGIITFKYKDGSSEVVDARI